MNKTKNSHLESGLHLCHLNLLHCLSSTVKQTEVSKIMENRIIPLIYKV